MAGAPSVARDQLAGIQVGIEPQADLCDDQRRR
jgi:hypothetical protein